MQQQAAGSAAFADRSISMGLRTTATQDQFTGVLNNDDVATANTLSRPRGRMARHLRNAHPPVAQKTREPDLVRSLPGKTSNERTRPSNQGRMQHGPPFSRRRSPNRPSSISIDLTLQNIPEENQPSPTRATKDVCIR